MCLDYFIADFSCFDMWNYFGVFLSVYGGDENIFQTIFLMFKLKLDIVTFREEFAEEKKSILLPFVNLKI